MIWHQYRWDRKITWGFIQKCIFWVSKWRTSWNMAAILIFWSAKIFFSISSPQVVVMPILMLVSGFERFPRHTCHASPYVALILKTWRGVNKCCFGGWKSVTCHIWCLFNLIRPIKWPWPLTFDFQIILKCHKFTYGIWFDRNRLPDHQIWTSRPRYMLFYRFEPMDWRPSWKYASKKIATG